jgi:hypothetical protein
MLVSQYGYTGCIFTPTVQQIATMQSLINDNVTSGIVVAADRQYTHPCKGGLGLINFESYLTALQCSWINDSWRWVLASSCNFILDNLRPDMFNKSCNPVHYDISVSFPKRQSKYWESHENFLKAHLVDIRFVLRVKPERRAPVRGCIDRNLLVHEFYETKKVRFKSLAHELSR